MPVTLLPPLQGYPSGRHLAFAPEQIGSSRTAPKPAQANRFLTKLGLVAVTMLIYYALKSTQRLSATITCMEDSWSKLVRLYRLRHGISQDRLALMMGVSQRTISRWERGEDKPSLPQQKRLRDLGWEPTGAVLSRLRAAVRYCPAPRALSYGDGIRLQAVSGPALIKRPSVVDWIGMDLAPIATGVLQEVLDDRDLQRAIANGEIASLVTTTRSVLRTAEHDSIGVWRTTITYFFHEGTIFSDAIGVPAPEGALEGYEPLPMDDAVTA